MTRARISGVLQSISTHVRLRRSTRNAQARAHRQDRVQRSRFVRVILQSVILCLRGATTIVLRHCLNVATQDRNSHVLALQRFVGGNRGLLRNVGTVLRHARNVRRSVGLRGHLREGTGSLLYLLRRTNGTNVQVSSRRDLLARARVGLSNGLASVFATASVLFPCIFRVEQYSRARIGITGCLLEVARGALCPHHVLRGVRFRRQVVICQVNGLLLVPVNGMGRVLARRQNGLVCSSSIFDRGM